MNIGALKHGLEALYRTGFLETSAPAKEAPTKALQQDVFRCRKAWEGSEALGLARHEAKGANSSCFVGMT